MSATFIDAALLCGPSKSKYNYPPFWATRNNKTIKRQRNRKKRKGKNENRKKHCEMAVYKKVRIFLVGQYKSEGIR